MAEYCEYMWDPTRGRNTVDLARSIYEEKARFDKRDKKLAIKTVRAILREMPDVDLKHCTDEYVTRFLLARKYRTEQAAALIAAYQAQIAHRQDIFGNLNARDPALQRALRAGIPGVLPARDKKGRCVLVILASQWDPIAVPTLSVQRAIFLVLETLIQDPRNQQSGFIVVVDWSGFSLRQGGALGAAAVRNLIAALRGRFPARFKAIHFLSAPLYVQATLALVKPFLDEKTRNKIYLHSNNLSTLHEHLPTDILPAELGGTGPAFNPGLWAEPVIHSAMKEAELAAAAAATVTAKKGKERHVDANVQEPMGPRNGSETANGNRQSDNERSVPAKLRDDVKMSSLNKFDNSAIKRPLGRANARTDVELNVINKRPSDQREREKSELASRNVEDNNANDRTKLISNGNVEETRHPDDRTDQPRDTDDLTFFDAESEINSNEFEIISSRPGSESSKDSSLDNRSARAFIVTDNSETPSEKTNLIT